MKVLTDYEFSARGRGKTYSYDVLFDGRTLELKRGEDFPRAVKIKSVRSGLATQANKRGLTLLTDVVDDDTLVIRAVARDASAPSPKVAAKRKPSARKRAATKPAPEPTGGVNVDALKEDPTT